jgi:hypothetical protein
MARETRFFATGGVAGSAFVTGSDMETMVFPDRSAVSGFPNCLFEFADPELQQKGPERYPITNEGPVAIWLYTLQEKGSVQGIFIYNYLKNGPGSYLKSCLNLQDALAIQAKGIEVFRKRFKGRSVFFWASVVQTQHGQFVPYLEEENDEVLLKWAPLEDLFSVTMPALRFGNGSG